jgi:hypothetical protein
MRRIRTLAATAAAALSVGVGHASAAHIDGPARAALHPAAGAVTALSVVPGEGRADVVIALTGPVQVADFTIEAPDRIVLDLTGARLNTLGRAYDRKARAGIRNIRISQYSPSVVRVVLDMDSPRQYVVSSADNQIRVSVTGGETFVAWSSQRDQSVVAEAPVEQPRSEPTENVAMGSVAPVTSAPASPVVMAPSPQPEPVRAMEPEVFVPRTPAPATRIQQPQKGSMPPMKRPAITLALDTSIEDTFAVVIKAPKRARAVNAADAIANPLPIAAVVFPTASNLSVR